MQTSGSNVSRRSQQERPTAVCGWRFASPMDESSGRPGIHGRVIVHADLDCFYCQVEHVRLGIPMSTPLAVQQWDGLIAINYAARKFGVKRGDRTEVAKQKCPEITLVHVETIATDDTSPGGKDGSKQAGGVVVTSDGAGDDVVSGGKEGNSSVSGSASIGAPRKLGSCKVSLERYRVASFAIMAIFQNHCHRVERASIDEAYLDLTEEAAKLCQGMEAGKGEDFASAPETDLQGTAGHRVDPTNAFDRALLAGARLSAAIRLAVKTELGFTVSVGIASNKVLAKLASSRNKPDKQGIQTWKADPSAVHEPAYLLLRNYQTVVPAGAASEMLDTVPLQKVRGLGGKLGQTVTSWSNAETASDLKNFGQQKLIGKFGPKTGEWLWRICRGMDDEAVTPNLRPKSLSVCKSFAPIRDREAVLRWMGLLCRELAHRISVDRVSWGRRVGKLTLQISSRQQSSASARAQPTKNGWRVPNNVRSRTADIPGGSEPPTAASLVAEGMSLFDKTEKALPCTRLVLSAHEFSGLVSGKGSIAAFLRAAPSPSSTTSSVSFENPGVHVLLPQKQESHRSGKGRVDGRRSLASASGKERNLVDNYFSKVDDGINAGVRGMRNGFGLNGGFLQERSATTDGRGDTLPSLLLADRKTSTIDNDLKLAVKNGDSFTPTTHEIVGENLCNECGKTVSEDGMREHLDFHFAEGLQKRYSRGSGSLVGKKRRLEEGSSASSADRSSSRGCRVAKPSVGRSSTKRIDSFFKPA